MKAIIAGILGILIGTTVGLFMLNIGWSLFASPVFGLPPLDVSQTFGLMLLIGIVSPSRGK
jgi:hypothetical protein